MHHQDRPTAIDTHAHVFPSFYLDFLTQHGLSESEVGIARNLNADSTDEDLSKRLDWMDKAGVKAQIIAVTPQSPYLPESKYSAQAATMINDEYARILSEYPDRFYAYGALPLPHVEASVAEVERIFTETGFVGVSISTIIGDGMYLNDSRLDPVWEALNDKNAIVNIHPTGCGADSTMLANADLHWVNGAPVEDATATLQLLKADVPGRFPNITFHIAHLGGDLPFLTQRIEDNYEDWDAFPSSPRAQLKKMYFDAANFYEPSLRLAAETFGSTQIMGGSDFPYFQEEKYVRAFDYIRGSQLSSDEIEAILAGNATRLYDRLPR
jgi:predicted TIM-barrel fold metal-dependent hydrolase